MKYQGNSKKYSLLSYDDAPFNFAVLFICFAGRYLNCSHSKQWLRQFNSKALTLEYNESILSHLFCNRFLIPHHLDQYLKVDFVFSKRIVQIE